MKAEDVECLLHRCDRQTAQGQRDDAILLLLARLGLRAGEGVALTLDDLAWEAGELLVRGKGTRQERLPLPHEVGEAFVPSICEGRPPSTTRQVFIRARAPQRGCAKSQAMGCKVQNACTLLPQFVAFLEDQGATFITTDEAVRWATQPQHVQPAAWARRLRWVRGFARYHHAIDSRTEIPPTELLPYRPQRHSP